MVCDPFTCDGIRQTLRSLRDEHQPRLHWGTESPDRREKIAATVTDIDMAAVVVIGIPLAKAKQERARRICMETLMPYLAAMGVDHVSLEARTPSLNDRDLKQVQAMRGKQLIPTALRINIAQPSTEPMLWIADIIAGVVGAARKGNPQYLALMRQTVTELTIPLR